MENEKRASMVEYLIAYKCNRVLSISKNIILLVFSILTIDYIK